MCHRIFELTFAGTTNAELIETRFYPGSGELPLEAVRGKTPGAYRSAGTFQLSSAVRALCILFVKAALARKSPVPTTPPLLLGFQGSLAASLDYALTKQPHWLKIMFGHDGAGRCLAQRFFHRTNPNRKRPGPVVLGMNEHVISPEDIRIFWNQESADQGRTRRL